MLCTYLLAHQDLVQMQLCVNSMVDISNKKSDNWSFALQKKKAVFLNTLPKI